jgi:bifunctional non-homologous end joining protein LigD
LRQAAFVGLRTDKDPRDCVREVPVPTPAPAPAANVTAAPSRFAVKPGSAEIGGRRIALSNQDKVLWPRDGYTKGDLVAYYRAVSPWMLPHLAARPLTMERYPNGIDQSSFFEKHKPRGMPEWIPTVTVPSDRGHSSAIEFIVCNDEATLAYVANLAAIVLHVWTSRVGSLDVPEFVFFDLDPWEGCTLKTLATVAVALRDALAQIGLESFVKSSGGSGLHVAVPLAPTYGYDVVKLFA